MRRTLRTAALAGLLMTIGGTARAQRMAPARPYVAYPPAYGYRYVYAQPGYGYGRMQPAYPRGVLPGFAPRGGIGTTPFLGNTMGLGAYSTNYDAPRPMYRRYR